MTERKKRIGRVMLMLTLSMLLTSIALWALGREANADWRGDQP